MIAVRLYTTLDVAQWPYQVSMLECNTWRGAVAGSSLNTRIRQPRYSYKRIIDLAQWPDRRSILLIDLYVFAWYIIWQTVCLNIITVSIHVLTPFKSERLSLAAFTFANILNIWNRCESNSINLIIGRVCKNAQATFGHCAKANI